MKLSNPSFQKGVEKIQNRNVFAMTSAEHVAYASLRIDGEDAESQEGMSSTTSTSSMTHKDRLERFKKERLGKFFVICQNILI